MLILQKNTTLKGINHGVIRGRPIRCGLGKGAQCTQSTDGMFSDFSIVCTGGNPLVEQWSGNQSVDVCVYGYLRGFWYCHDRYPLSALSRAVFCEALFFEPVPSNLLSLRIAIQAARGCSVGQQLGEII